jgi:hypothetical protein
MPVSMLCRPVPGFARDEAGDLRFGGEREVTLEGISDPQRAHAVEWR